MRKTYRNCKVKDYWKKRWENISVDNAMENPDVYPLKYAELTISSNDGRILEAGCGAGRILRYYHNLGYDITGIDFIECAIAKMKIVEPELNVEVGDITNLKYEDKWFKYILAFGLYHNFDYSGINSALQETHRVLDTGGKVCASFRADNLQTKISDWIVSSREIARGATRQKKEFHKLNLKKKEFRKLFEEAGFAVESIFSASNMPFLYKFSFFRSNEHKIFNESKARKEGYRLSRLGSVLQKILIRFSPDQFCNVYVLIARKPD